MDDSAILKDAERTHGRLRRRLHTQRTTAHQRARTKSRVPAVEGVGGVACRLNRNAALGQPERAVELRPEDALEDLVVVRPAPRVVDGEVDDHELARAAAGGPRLGQVQDGVGVLLGDQLGVAAKGAAAKGRQHHGVVAVLRVVGLREVRVNAATRLPALELPVGAVAVHVKRRGAQLEEGEHLLLRVPLVAVDLALGGARLRAAHADARVGQRGHVLPLWVVDGGNLAPPLLGVARGRTVPASDLVLGEPEVQVGAAEQVLLLRRAAVAVAAARVRLVGHVEHHRHEAVLLVEPLGAVERVLGRDVHAQVGLAVQVGLAHRKLPSRELLQHALVGAQEDAVRERPTRGVVLEAVDRAAQHPLARAALDGLRVRAGVERVLLEQHLRRRELARQE